MRKQLEEKPSISDLKILTYLELSQSVSALPA